MNAPQSGKSERLRVSPLARKFAEENNIDLALVPGTGTGGKITQADIEKAVKDGTAVKLDGSSEDSKKEFEEIPLRGMRKIIASRLVQSKAPIPHFYLTVDIGMDGVVAKREEIKKMKIETKISYNDIVMKIIADTLKDYPNVNARLEDETIRQYHDVHLGFAVALDDGLITPVIRNCDTKSLVTIAKEVSELAGLAILRKLRRQHYEGATFTVSNLGMFGIENFSAIINPPEGAILAIGAIEKRPVVVDDTIAVQHRMKMTISADHRVMDGAQAAKFLQNLKQNIEHPDKLALWFFLFLLQTISNM